MKKTVQLRLLTLAAIISLASCKKESKPSNQGSLNVPGANGVTAFSNSDLIAYKNSPHKIFVGFLVGDGADPAASFNPVNAPDSLDFIEFFAGNDQNKSHWRAAQAKGTRIVVCHFLRDAYFDGSSKDPATPTSTATVPNANSTYDHWASAMYQQHIVVDSLDGIDLDIESGTLGDGVSSTSYPKLLTSVAKYFGPSSTSPVTKSMGKKPVFFYDTDGSADNNTLVGPSSNYDYVLFQAYTTGSHFWSGSGTQNFGPLVTGYGLSKLIFLVNGDSFKHPDGSEDQAGGDAKATSDLYSYANWVKSNNGAGVGAYRMSRDYNHTPNFAVSRKAIQLMNAPVADITDLPGVLSAQFQTGSPTGEEYTKAIDNNTATKYLTFNPSGWIQFQPNTAAIVTKYTITSANDEPTRDPKNWILQGSNNGTTWTNLDTQTNQSFASRFLKKTYSFTNTTTYAYYRLSISAVQSGSILQFSEWELLRN